MTLIERLEALTGPRREAFDEAFMAVHGPKPTRIHGGSQEMADWLALYNPFFKLMEAGAWLDAAMTLVPETHCWNVTDRRGILGIKPNAQCWTAAERSTVHGDATSPAIALCIAALKARQ